MTTRTTINEIKYAIRNKYAWPGGYEFFGICSDGGTLCPDCMKENFYSILWSIKNGVSDGWKVEAIDSAQNLECEEYISDNPEEYSLTSCVHCNKILNP
jgi:hypothetical protein